jgi:hypothetical protein
MLRIDDYHVMLNLIQHPPSKRKPCNKTEFVPTSQFASTPDQTPHGFRDFERILSF